MKERKKPHSAEFRGQMLELIKAGRNPKELADEFGCHVTTLRDWMKQGGVVPEGQSGTVVLTDKERAELQRLRKENRQLRIERDILSKATAWFARQDGGIVQ